MHHKVLMWSAPSWCSCFPLAIYFMWRLVIIWPHFLPLFLTGFPYTLPSPLTPIQFSRPRPYSGGLLLRSPFSESHLLQIPWWLVQSPFSGVCPSVIFSVRPLRTSPAASALQDDFCSSEDSPSSLVTSKAVSSVRSQHSVNKDMQSNIQKEITSNRKKKKKASTHIEGY